MIGVSNNNKNRLAAYLTLRYMRTFEFVVEELTRQGNQPGNYKRFELTALHKHFENLQYKNMNGLDFTTNLISGLLVRHTLPNVNHRTTFTFVNGILMDWNGLKFSINGQDPRFSEYFVNSKRILHTRDFDSDYAAKHLKYTREWLSKMPQSGKLASISAKSLMDALISKSNLSTASDWTNMLSKYSDAYINNLLRRK